MRRVSAATSLIALLFLLSAGCASAALPEPLEFHVSLSKASLLGPEVHVFLRNVSSLEVLIEKIEWEITGTGMCRSEIGTALDESLLHSSWFSRHINLPEYRELMPGQWWHHVFLQPELVDIPECGVIVTVHYRSRVSKWDQYSSTKTAAIKQMAPTSNRQALLTKESKASAKSIEVLAMAGIDSSTKKMMDVAGRTGYPVVVNLVITNKSNEFVRLGVTDVSATCEQGATVAGPFVFAVPPGVDTGPFFLTPRGWTGAILPSTVWSDKPVHCSWAISLSDVRTLEDVAPVMVVRANLVVGKQD